jgi:hypothetical protein
MSMELQRTANGALSGVVAAGVWAAQQPLDKRAFGTSYDDVELLGRFVTREGGWPAAGLAVHLANGAAFGALYAVVRPLFPGPPIAAGLAAGLAEHVGFWPLVRLVDRYHPARRQLEPLWGNRNAFWAATWRHLLFGLVLAELERRLNADASFEPLEDVPVSSNGHGNIERAAVGAAEES